MSKDLNGSVTWLGHSAFLIESVNAKRILVDPFLDGNPKYPGGVDLDSIDAVLVTHGHSDHVGDTITIAKHGATVVAQVELASILEGVGVPASSLVAMNKGGTAEVHGIGVTMVNAFHSTSYEGAEYPIYAGEAAGYVITLEDGYVIYHAGDTMIFGDMKLIGELWRPDLALLPIGGFYTMDPRQAGHALGLLGASDVIGMHWGTFPPLVGTPAQLREYAPATCTVHELRPGESIGRVHQLSR